MNAVPPPDPDILDGPPRAPGNLAVRPRDAATLILVRRDGPKPRILMGRRNAGHDFMPSKWVFPGGRLDRSDHAAPFATDLRPEVHARLALTTPPGRCRPIALAAVRETFEETGLLLAKPAAARPGAGPWRDFLAQGAEPDLAALDFVAQAITPPMVRKRFNARFFMAPAEALLSLDRLPDCGELDELAWLELAQTADVDLAMITRIVVQELEERLTDPDRSPLSMRFVRGKRTFTRL